MKLPRGARRCEKADSIGGKWGFLRRSFLREWEHFAAKVGKAKRENALPSITILPPLVISSAARNLPCTKVKRRASDEEQPKHLGNFIITSIITS